MPEFRYTLEELESVGLAVRGLLPEQQHVLRNLTAEEFAVLVHLRQRLDDVAPDVEAHSEIAGAALF